MGPRPFGRGMQRPARRQRVRRPASMGPRPFGRGMCKFVSARRIAPSGFNGAATFRSRNVPPTVLAVNVGSSCFNGAATFRSRNAHFGRPRGPERLASMGPRPFGRGMWDAPQQSENHHGASMGPRPFGRGMAGLVDVADGAHAASMGSRPFGRGMSLLTPQAAAGSGLQWGRDLSVAECRAAVCRHAARRSASMGPRPFGRGMRSMLSKSSARSPLQWGRDLSVAEWPLTCRRLPWEVMLQWGRDLSVAEWALRPRVSLANARSFNGAATFRSRNDVMEFNPYAVGRPLQWGRDLSVAECRKVRVKGSGRSVASMGPRPFGRGMRR